MLNATLNVVGIGQTYDVTKRLAHFKIILPPGTYDLEVVCHMYQNKMVHLTVTEENMLQLKVVMMREGTNPEVYNGTIVKTSANTLVMTDFSIKKPFLGPTKTGVKGKVFEIVLHYLTIKCNLIYNHKSLMNKYVCRYCNIFSIV